MHSGVVFMVIAGFLGLCPKALSRDRQAKHIDVMAATVASETGNKGNRDRSGT